MKTSVLALGALLLVPSVEAAPNLQPGMWELRVKMTMEEAEGMPAMPEQVFQRCMQAKDLEAGITAPPEGECKVSGYKTSGDSAEWQVECGGSMPMRGKGRMTSTPTAYQGEIEMKMEDGDGGMTMHHVMSGKRLGDCP